MLKAAHPCLQEKLLATGLFSSCSVGGHAEHNTAKSPKAKPAQAEIHKYSEKGQSPTPPSNSRNEGRV